MEPFDLKSLIQKALAEDRSDADITSHACVDAIEAEGKILLKQSGCIAGLEFLPELLLCHDPSIVCERYVKDGSRCKKGTVLARLSGPARSLLSVERVALNFLQHLSGIATLTAQCVKKASSTQCKILDTRKTLPGLRFLEKYAVKMGGGVNHRHHLEEKVLIKNNHLALASSLEECIARAKKGCPGKWIEIEIGSSQDLPKAIEAGADGVLLDNMSVEEIKRCVEINRKKVHLEASGGIRLKNVKQFAETGVDAISIGALTHSAPALDICMRITGVTNECKS